ncbi:MAG: DUF3306 domain-containing protein [Kiloniellales bacterium]|nr:DUF3306 domain-containing protein [Kiloniellales bacterium]
MAGADEEPGNGGAFLARWARRKGEQRQTTPSADPEPAEAGGPGEVESAGEAEPPLRVEDLPDIDSLDEGSDFTVFLKEGVPESLRRRALRRLWRLNPVFANLDGLAEYDEDYHTVLDLPGGVKTLFKAGKGMVQPETEEPPATPEEVAAAEPLPETGAPGTEAEGPASLPEEPATPPPEAPEPEHKTPGAADAAVSPAEPAPVARGSAVKRRWGAFEA